MRGRNRRGGEERGEEEKRGEIREGEERGDREGRTLPLIPHFTRLESGDIEADEEGG